MLFFILGVVIASLYCLGLGVYRIVVLDASFQYLTYTDLSVFMHPSYFSMYLCVGVLLIYFLWKTGSNIGRKFNITFIFISILFVSMIVLLSSKTGVIVLLLLLLLLANNYIKKKVRLLIILLLLGGVFSTIFFINPRFKSMRNQLSNIFNTENYEEQESSALRVVLWSNAFELIQDNWIIGVGAGDLKYDLTEQAGIEAYDENDNRIYFNAHNQWLETLLSSGVIGLAIILGWLFLPFRNFSESGNYKILVSGVFLIIFTNGLFESIINRQEGIIFILFFWTMVTLLARKSVQESIESNS